MTYNLPWKVINGFSNYLISNQGQVFSRYRNKILKNAVDTDGYNFVRLCKNKKYTNKKIHRLVYEFFGENWNEKLSIDHINRNKIDNSIKNLRMATDTQQKYNQIYKNKLGYTGVSKHRKKYTASIRINGIKTFIGSFKTIEEAGEAYKIKAKEIHGEFFL